MNHLRLNNSNSLEFGIEAKFLVNDYDNFYNEYTDALGDTTPAFGVDKRLNAGKYGLFFNYISQPLNRLSTILGIRADNYSYNKNITLSPRISLSYKIDERMSINASTGIFYQNLPILLVSQNNSNKGLSDPKSVHYILGIDYLVTENAKFSIEFYYKDYRNFPVDPAQPSLFLIDELYYRYGFFFNHEQLIDKGKAYSSGIELLMQKKLAKDFYGLASFSYFKTQYLGNDNKWRDRVYDNRIAASFEGGYKPNNKWEFRLRWIYAGGPPYTPFDIEKSTLLNRAVLDKNRINEMRYPDYHSLNVRFDRRFHYSSSNLVFYLSVWNAYSRKNVANYFWNEAENKQDTIYQWTMLPIFGLEFEF